MATHDPYILLISVKVATKYESSYPMSLLLTILLVFIGLKVKIAFICKDTTEA